MERTRALNSAPRNSRGRRKKKRKSDFLLTFILVIAIGVFLFAAYNLYHIYTEYKKGSDEYNAIAQMVVTERTPDGEREAQTPNTQTEPSVAVPMSIDFAALKQVNDDVIGWIYIEALDGISYPIVRGIDNSYYLHMTYQKNYNFAGTIFADYENSDDFNDCNTIVYGHNMKNGSMFGQLRRFSTNADAYNKSKYFWIFTPDKDYRYEIISAYVTGVTSDTYTLFKGPGEEFVEYMKKIVERSEILTTPGELTVQDHIVTLSTCTGDDTTRYVVQGKRVDVVRK
ncbi:MAG: class B sortase [Blautia sp.]|nr:class B sortase [Blautia sp.]